MKVLADGIGGALKPIRVRHRLLGGEHLDESFSERIEAVCVANVPIERSGVELREDEDPLEPGVQAVAYGNVDQPVFAAQRNSWFRSVLGEREETLSGATCQND